MDAVELAVKLALDAKEYTKGLGEVTKKTAGWAKSLGSKAMVAGTAAIAGGALVAATAVGSIGMAAIDASSQVKQAKNNIVASLGATEAEAERLGDIGVEVFKDNFAGSIEEATAAVADARKQLGDLSDNELKNATENAFRLADTFEVDVNESFNAAAVLMDKFGLSQQDAFDMIASGFQKGLNNSDDFLDSITEYGNLFAENGASAAEMFSIMETGMQGGVLGTDKAMDLFKEFGIRIRESGEYTGDITEDFKRLSAEVAAIEDPVKRNARAVELFGTMWEDLGESAVLAIDPMETGLDDLAGATDKLDAKYNNFGSMWEGIKRKATIALIPIGDKVLELANQAMPYVEQAFGWFEKKLPEIMNTASVVIGDLSRAFEWLFKGKGADFDGLGDTVGEIMSLLGMKVSGKEGPYDAIVDGVYKVWDILVVVRDFIVNVAIPAFQNFISWLINDGAPAFIAFVTPIIQQVIPGLQLLGKIVADIAVTAWPYLQAAIGWVTDNLNIILPILGAVGVAILAITSPISLVIGAIVLLATAWANNWGGIQEKTQAVIDFIWPYIETGINAISNIVSSVLGYLNKWWDDHGDNLITVVKFVWAFIQKTVKNRIDKVRSVIKAVGNLIAKFWEDWGDTLMTLASLAWDNIKTIVTAAMDIIGFVIDAAAALIRGDWEAFGDALKNIWKTAWDAVNQILENAKTALMAVIANLISIIVNDYWIPFVSKIETLWSDAWDVISDYADSVKESLKKSVKDVIAAVTQTFTNAISGENGMLAKWEKLWSDIKNVVVNVKTQIMSVVQPIINAIQDIIDKINSIPAVPDIFGGDEDNFRASNYSLGGGGDDTPITNNYFNQTNYMSGSGFSSIGEFDAMASRMST